MENNKSLNETLLVNGESGWICPKCGRALSPNIIVCPYCGEKNPDATIPNYEDLESNIKPEYKPLNS